MLILLILEHYKEYLKRQRRNNKDTALISSYVSNNMASKHIKQNTHTQNTKTAERKKKNGNRKEKTTVMADHEN